MAARASVCASMNISDVIKVKCQHRMNLSLLHFFFHFFFYLALMLPTLKAPPTLNCLSSRPTDLKCTPFKIDALLITHKQMAWC